MAKGPAQQRRRPLRVAALQFAPDSRAADGALRIGQRRHHAEADAGRLARAAQPGDVAAAPVAEGEIRPASQVPRADAAHQHGFEERLVRHVRQRLVEGQGVAQRRPRLRPARRLSPAAASAGTADRRAGNARVDAARRSAPQAPAPAAPGAPPPAPPGAPNAPRPDCPAPPWHRCASAGTASSADEYPHQRNSVGPPFRQRVDRRVGAVRPHRRWRDAPVRRNPPCTMRCGQVEERIPEPILVQIGDPLAVKPQLRSRIEPPPPPPACRCRPAAR